MIEGHSHLGHNRIKRSSKRKQTKPKNKKNKRQSRRKVVTSDNDDNSSSSSDDDDDNDSQDLDIWACEFEPSINSNNPSTLVALCGGSSILFLDTQQGRHVKKYTHPEPLECFYTLAWTLLQQSDNVSEDDPYAAILAVAGKFGSIKLLEPTQAHCYRYLFGHQQPVLKLNFATKEPRWLLSSSMDMSVRLWDIGTPANEIDDSCCLAHFTVPGTSYPTSMSLSYDLSLLAVGTSKADLLQYGIQPTDVSEWRRITRQSKSYKNNDDDDGDDEQYNPTIIKPKTKFPHGQEWHDGYVEDIYILGQDGDENELNNHIVSRGSNDMEVLMWNPKTSTKTDADIYLSLDWPESDDCTGLRFCIVEKDGRKRINGLLYIITHLYY
ncbi:uncharacterized protein BX664DRAFT_264707 [Halteromyces radiatus]|uniref:uncharacterized protein n=1 Tax=Halteromyces radiatus TaxID=101107 RepID=UPI00221E8958|nr:uncharacterized protein BX664DRAFT_264707 [Halteromyces radiatus]KAI8086452.1 hypothetical protein BX664DRAFT_264707 [Halteromyces radiatus]